MTECILFVTGRLAEPSLRDVLARLEPAEFEARVEVLGISVAALMHVEWVARKLPKVPADVTRVILPGWCQGDLTRLQTQWQKPVQLGPKDVRDLPEMFGRKDRPPADLSTYTIEILAEINHAPKLSDSALVAEALRLKADGADLIDLGCIPGETWSEIGTATQRLRDLGLRVSVDSFNRVEVEAAVRAGAELVLSVNATNRDWLLDLPVESVLIPDDPRLPESMLATLEQARSRGCRVRLDPILEPIGFGFAASLERYAQTRKQNPEEAMLMGIGNVTELSEVDSAGLNFLLAAVCQEWNIGSVLTTQVIHWGRTAVKEFDIARRLVAWSLREKRLPKHVDAGLVALRDGPARELGEVGLSRLQAGIKDPNYRIFAERGEVHILNRDGYWHSADPFELFDQLGPLDASHAFYLGYEFAKARTALTLGKQYLQDESLSWGFLTVPETSALHRRAQHRKSSGADAES